MIKETYTIIKCPTTDKYLLGKTTLPSERLSKWSFIGLPVTKATMELEWNKRYRKVFNTEPNRIGFITKIESRDRLLYVYEMHLTSDKELSTNSLYYSKVKWFKRLPFRLNKSSRLIKTLIKGPKGRDSFLIGKK